MSAPTRGDIGSFFQYDNDCFYYHSWRNNVVMALGTLLSLIMSPPVSLSLTPVFWPDVSVLSSVYYYYCLARAYDAKFIAYIICITCVSFCQHWLFGTRLTHNVVHPPHIAGRGWKCTSRDLSTAVQCCHDSVQLQVYEYDIVRICTHNVLPRSRRINTRSVWSDAITNLTKYINHIHPHTHLLEKVLLLESLNAVERPKHETGYL